MAKHWKIAINLLMVVIVLLIGIKYFDNYQKIKQMKAEINTIQEATKELKEENKALKEELARINDPDYIEEIARKELGLVKPGELLLIPVKDQDEINNRGVEGEDKKVKETPKSSE